MLTEIKQLSAPPAQDSCYRNSVFIYRKKSTGTLLESFYPSAFLRPIEDRRALQGQWGVDPMVIPTRHMAPSE